MKPLAANDPNVALMDAVAARLGPAIVDEVVFVGGASVGLLVTDPGAPPVRPTQDVDVIVQAVSLADYYRIERALSERGLTRDTRADAPICRWMAGPVPIDVMPTLPDVLGFANRWYALALETATKVALPSGTEIRLISAPSLVATKLEAFDGRGRGDYLLSHDLGDVVALVDGRAGLLGECHAAPRELRDYLAERFARSRRSGLRTSAHTPAACRAGQVPLWSSVGSVTVSGAGVIASPNPMFTCTGRRALPMNAGMVRRP